MVRSGMTNRGSEQPLHWPRAWSFAWRFALAAGVGLTLYCFPYAPDGSVEQWFSAYLAGYARTAGFVLSQFEPGVSVNGTSITGRTALEIVKNCDAMETIVLFGAAVIAVPGRLRDRALAVGTGISLLVALNLMRICSLYYAQIYLPDAFDTIHMEVWPPLLVACAALQFMGWARWLEQRNGSARVAG